MAKDSLPQIVLESAQHCGFHLAGITSVLGFEGGEGSGIQDSPELAYFAQWVAEGRAGEMEYLKRRDAENHLLRSSVTVPFPWVRSVIVCAVNYNNDQPYSIDVNPATARADSGWIARYAWSGRVHNSQPARPGQDAQAGESASRLIEEGTPTEISDTQGDVPQQFFPTDYHSVIKERLEHLRDQLQARIGTFESRCFVDTGPLVERIYAKYAGLGWQGKNTCMIHESLGSWFFLGVILTSLELPREDWAQPMPDRCGSCTRCLDACPTSALEPYRMDASRCIAYLTIEKRGAISEELAPKIGRNVFGCDICQEICPWNNRGNRRPPVTDWPELQPRSELINPALEWLANLREEGYRRMFRHSPVERTKYAGLMRNVEIAIENSRKN